MKKAKYMICALLAGTVVSQAAISVETGLPAGAFISNPTGTSGYSTIESGNIKGNSFVLSSAQEISSVTFMIRAVTDVSGSITLDFYNLTGTPDSTASNGQVPTGASLFSQNETLPSSPALVAGDYVTLTLNTPLALGAGNYAFTISTTDTKFNAELNKDNAYIQGELMKNEGSWEDRLNDLVFALETGGTPDPVPQINSFTTSENLVASNTTVTLDWSTTNATYANLDQGIGEVATTGSTNVVITAPVTFTLTATNEFGNTTSSVSIGVTTPRPPASSGPNVVFVLVDDWGWTDHDNSAMAQGFQSDFYQTPNFSRLVDAGVAFTSTYAQPNCAPTRGALLTGQYSCRSGNGVYNVTSLNRAGRTTYTTPADQGDEHANGDEQTITIGEAFINSGYVTAHFGKYHAGASDPDDPTYPLNQGFDFNYGGKNDGAPGTYFASGGASSVFGSRIGPELDPFAADYSSTYIADNLAPYSTGNNPATLDGTAKHLTDAMGDAFVSFMNNHRSGSMSNYPAYAQLHFYAVHGPIQPRPDLKTKYNGLPGGTLHNDPAYAALVEGMDHSLGRVMDYLADPNGDGDTADSIAENTLLVFCSDNGGTAESNLPLRNIKGTHFDGGIRVPCVISMPGTIPTNKVSDTLVHIVDFYPTMLDFAGGVYPDSVTHPLDGVSLRDHLLDPDHTVRNREPIFYHFPGYMDTRAYNCSVVIKNLEGKRYKYIYSDDPYYDPSDDYDQYQLYCLTDDIGETVNLLDYIDLVVDGTDPSTPEEYWNYILYKDIGAELAADLHHWLDHGSTNPDGPADPTWTPIYATYKDTFPGIAPELVGQETGPAPAIIPELVIPEGEIFRVLNADENVGSNQVTIEFRSEAGFNYAIDASSNLVDWVEIASNIAGQVGSTVHVADDPALSTATSRFYRAILKAN